MKRTQIFCGKGPLSIYHHYSNSFLKYCKQKIKDQFPQKWLKSIQWPHWRENSGPYEIKNCRGGQNRALCISSMIWHAMCPVYVLSSISTYFNIIWNHGCAITSIVCIRPYFDLLYNFLFHKDFCKNQAEISKWNKN